MSELEFQVSENQESQGIRKSEFWDEWIKVLETQEARESENQDNEQIRVLEHQEDWRIGKSEYQNEWIRVLESQENQNQRNRKSESADKSRSSECNQNVR